MWWSDAIRCGRRNDWVVVDRRNNGIFGMRCFSHLLLSRLFGYGDDGISEVGRRFAIVLLICGIGTFTYSLSTLIQFAVDREAALLRRMKRTIRETSDHVVICGYGRIGRTVCHQLSKGGVTCVIIEPYEQNYQQAIQDGYLVVQGAASDDEILVEAGVTRAKGVVCAVDSDAENMFITVSVRDLNSNCTIVSRAESESAARKLERAGATIVISPHKMAGQSIAGAMLHPCLNHFMGNTDDEDCLQLSETKIAAESQFNGKSVCDLGRLSEDVVFVAIQRETGEQIIRPRGDETFQAGDVVILAGKTCDLDSLHENAQMAVSV